jgi:hypothetical protein
MRERPGCEGSWNRAATDWAFQKPRSISALRILDRDALPAKLHRLVKLQLSKDGAAPDRPVHILGGERQEEISLSAGPENRGIQEGRKHRRTMADLVQTSLLADVPTGLTKRRQDGLDVLFAIEVD